MEQKRASKQKINYFLLADIPLRKKIKAINNTMKKIVEVTIEVNTTYIVVTLTVVHIKKTRTFIITVAVVKFSKVVEVDLIVLLTEIIRLLKITDGQVARVA